MIRPAAIMALALILALAAGCGGSDSSSSQTESTNPGAAEIVSASSLRDTAAEGKAPIYWAGEQEGTKLELSRPDDERTYVRYLTGDAEAGDKRAAFLTVSTYAQPNAVASLRRQSRRSGGTIAHAADNGTVYFDRTNPKSVYLAYPGTPVEIEVFDPNFKRALRLVESGQVVAVG